VPRFIIIIIVHHSLFSFGQAGTYPQKASTARPATAPGSLGLLAVGPPTSVSLNHSICYTAIHFDSSFGEPRTLIGDIKKVCLLLKMGNMPGSKKTRSFYLLCPKKTK
jgi:hypothetical protein